MITGFAVRPNATILHLEHGADMLDVSSLSSTCMTLTSKKRSERHACSRGVLVCCPDPALTVSVRQRFRVSLDTTGDSLKSSAAAIGADAVR